MPTVNFGSFSKKRNSTKQPASLSDQRTVRLKETTSIDAPTFIITGDDFDYNYAQWGNRYYFIVDVRSVHNGLTEIDCVLDPLATYKSEILASTQYVSYSSVSGGSWLVDTRIPILKSATVATSSTAIGILDEDGFYVLSVIGKESAATYRVSLTNIKDILDQLNNWETAGISAAKAEIVTSSDPAVVLESVGKALVQTGFVGNAYADAPNCIRSCIWVPFGYALYDSTDYIWLGNFNSHVQARKLSTKPTKNTSSVSIPWQYSDWRRAQCEEVYLYLPLVGMVSIPSDEIVNESALTIDWSATATDGCISYEVKAGSQIVGTYGGNASANYPIGISQQASAGEIAQSVIAGTEKVLSSGIETAKSVERFSIAGTAGGAAMTAFQGFKAAYDIANTGCTRHNTCIGGVGGGAGSGLDLNAKCFTVAHPTIISPSDMQQTMGLPTMKPLQLSQCSGFCQCVNAHIEAPAMAAELDAIDAMLNSGFYIE
ncbi:MAG: hypothetical protein J6R32_00110 [Bacteroidales bacterium]|nr:hypothetical protein [Bacteroidales bacterium]